jgi:hypothetical protein
VHRRTKQLACAVWLAAILALAALHALHLSADFPNGSTWHSDWAKYTDEGWWANAAVRAHLLGNWYLSGDFNPAAAQPVWPALEWLAFAIAGVSIQAARGLVILFFFANLALSYLLVRSRAPRWAGLLAITLIAASPFLYSFSRLAILEPALIAFTLAALNVAVRIGRFRRPQLAAATIGLLLALMMLTKLSAVFLAPALVWAMALSLIAARRPLIRYIAVASATTAAIYGLWILVIFRTGLLPDFRYLLFVNNYPKPANWTWPFTSLWWSFHGALWIDHLFIPLAGCIIIAACIARRGWGRTLLSDPAFGASFWAAAGCILFMTWQDHPQPRYYTLVAFFCFVIIALGAAALVEPALLRVQSQKKVATRALGWAVIVAAASAIAANTARTVSYAAHPQYTFVNAARSLAAYVNAHPNGRPMLVSVSGDELMLITHLPALCDDFGTVDLPDKLAQYRPGWFAAWNDFDPGTLQDLHTHYSVEQVASFPAFDDPDRNVLVLYKLHPLPNGKIREYSGGPDLRQPLPGDKIDVDMQ